MKRTELKSRYRNTGPDSATVEMVWVRDHGRCAKCGGFLRGQRGVDWSVQHRRPRGRGGDRRPDTNLTGNLVLLDGHGTAGCNFDVESQRTESRASGLLVSQWATPTAVPIEHAVHGRVLLDDEGGWTPCVSS